MRAQKTIKAVSDIEFRYDMLLGNFLDLQRMTFEIIASSTLRYKPDMNSLLLPLVPIGRVFQNFLSTASAYVGQFRSSALKSLKQGANLIVEQERDRSFEFRVMESLRNHAMHKGLPVRSYRPHGGWENITDPKLAKRKERMAISLSVEDLLQDPRSSSDVLQELKQRNPNDIDLLAWSKHYLESLSKIHIGIRELMKDEENQARSLRAAAVTRFAELNGKLHMDFVLATEKDSSGNVCRETYLNPQLENLVDSLRSRNKALGAYSRVEIVV